MSGNLLEKYASRGASSGSVPDAVSDADGIAEDLGAFGWLRGPRERAVMLELRKKSGNIVAVGYGFIDRAEFNPSEGITLHCGRQTVKIRGRNLNSEVRPQIRLFQGITRQRVSFIQEAEQSAVLQGGKDAVIVESIEW